MKANEGIYSKKANAGKCRQILYGKFRRMQPNTGEQRQLKTAEGKEKKMKAKRQKKDKLMTINGKKASIGK